MDGIKKTALFLSGLEWKTVDLLLAQLDSETAKAVRREMMSLEKVSAVETNRLAREFLVSAGGGSARRERSGGEYIDQESLTYSPPWRQPRPMPQSRPSMNTRTTLPFDFLRKWAPEAVAQELAREYPQTAVIVLKNMEASFARTVLERMPEAQREQVLRRMISYEPVDSLVLEEIEISLRERFREGEPMKPEMEDFDSLLDLNDDELSRLFHVIDPTTATLALVGANPVLIRRIVARFTPMREHRMKQEIEQLGRFDQEDIRNARKRVLSAVHY